MIKDLSRVLRDNESHMRQAAKGSRGICAACYEFARITRHHIKPRSVVKPGTDAVLVIVCRKCHAAVHKAASNETLAESHATIADAIAAMRKARGISFATPVVTEAKRLCGAIDAAMGRAG